MQSQSQLLPALVTIAMLGLVVRRTLRTQTVRVWALIGVPLLIIIVAIGVVRATPPTSVAGTLAIVGGAVAGAALGYVRAMHTKVELGPRRGTLVVQGNVVLVAILVGAFALRLGVRSFAGSTGLGLALSDAFIVFAAASVAVARGLLFFSWRRLAAGARTSAA